MSSINIYTSPLCSCIYCHKVKSSKGIHSHFLALHGSTGEKENQVGRIMRKPANHNKQRYEAQQLRLRYSISPNYCLYCGIVLLYNKRNQSYCSHICSATNTNRIRTQRGWSPSTDHRNKTSKTLKTNGSSNQYGNHQPRSKDVKKVLQDTIPEGPYTRVYLCTCKYSNQLFYSTTAKQIHPNLSRDKKNIHIHVNFDLVFLNILYGLLMHLNL